MAAHWVMGLSWPVSLQISALIIVTGPTVIAPILRNVPLNRSVANVLKWEGILIDPIGAVIAVLMFEFLMSGDTVGQYSGHAILEFTKVTLIGLASTCMDMSLPGKTETKRSGDEQQIAKVEPTGTCC